jgi:RNA recognition motif-containing protein
VPSREPRGFAFIEFWDSRDASEAQRRMNHKMVCGREIIVVRAEGKRKHPDGTPRETGFRYSMFINYVEISFVFHFS